MASSSTSLRSIHNENDYGNTSVPDFRKTVVFLEGWWLIKAEEDVEGKRLAVAGFTSRGTHQAVRVFSSAPILKVYDVFTLETTDGICVILGGIINKARTEENGFPSDVFNQFVFGFPPHWEEFAEKCLGGGFAKDVATGSKLGTDKSFMNSGIASMRDSSEGTPQSCEAISKVSHVDSDKKDMGVEDCEDLVLENGQHRSGGRESSVEVPKELLVDISSGVSNVDLEGTVEIFSSTSESGGHRNIMVIPASNYVDNMKIVSFENPSISINSTMETINSFNKSMQQEDSIHHMTRSSKRMKSKENEMKGNRMMQGHSEREETEKSTFLNAKIDDASMESSLPKSSDLDSPSNVNKAVFNEVLQLEDSRHHMTRSSKRMDSKENERKGNKMTEGHSEGKESEKSKFCNATIDDASTESSLSKIFDLDNTNPSNVNKAVFMENSCMNTRSFIKGSDRSTWNEKHTKGKLKSWSTSFQIPEVVVRCEDDNLLGIDYSSLSGFVPGGTGKIENPSTLELPGNCLDDTIRKSTGLLGLEGNVLAPSIFDTDGSIMTENDETRRNKLKNLSGNKEENAASNCNAEYRSGESNFTLEAFENLDRENLNNKSSISPVGFGKRKRISKEIAWHSEARTLRPRLRYSEGKQKDDQTTVSMLEDERSKLNSVSVDGSDQAENLLDDGPQDPMDEFTIRNPDIGCVKYGSEQCVTPQDQNCGDIMVQAGTQKNTNETVKYDIRLRVADDNNCLKSAVGEKEIISKEASTTRKKTKRKLTYACPITRREREKASIVSPESFSSKRSRSGRLLLPTLEFWRNQTAIYDADRQITGIKEDRHAMEPSRGSKSEPQRKRKQFK